MNNFKRIALGAVAVAGSFLASAVAFADNNVFSVSDATSTTNVMNGNVETAILYSIGTLLAAAVGLGLVGWAWRHIKRIVGLKRF